ncbi:MAG: I78 family peptidase inhibitor [Acidovorax sp.]|nr:I78 family peptidase inhibitor [Acidovorax sp.]
MRHTLWMVACSTVAAGLMAGCAGHGAGAKPTPTAPGAPPVGGQCNAAPAQSFVGKDSTASVVEAARVQSGAHMARVLRPGQLITKEYNEQRLNLLVDDSGRITAVRCG